MATARPKMHDAHSRMGAIAIHIEVFELTDGYLKLDDDTRSANAQDFARHCVEGPPGSDSDLTTTIDLGYSYRYMRSRHCKVSAKAKINLEGK